MQFFIGKAVRVKTSLGDEFEGEIFAIDVEQSASVMLRDPKTDKYTWIKTAFVREIISIDRPTSTPQEPLYLPPVDWDAIARREQEAQQHSRS